MNVKQLQREYEAHLLAEEKRTKGIRYALRIFNRYLDEASLELLRLNHKEAQDFQSWLSAQGERYSAGTILGIIGPLSAYYDYLVKRKAVLLNPFLMIERIRKPSRLPGNIPDEKQMDEFLNHFACFGRGKSLSEYKARYKAHVLAELLYSTGMRISEAAAIKTDEVDLVSGTVAVHDIKNKKERIAFLNEYTCNILRIYLDEFREKVLWRKNGADESLLFGSKTNLGIWMRDRMAEACTEMGIRKMTPHIFRHAYAYHLFRAGCDIRKVQKFLGHERLHTTSIYAKVDTEALRNIVDRFHPRGGIK